MTSKVYCCTLKQKVNDIETVVNILLFNRSAETSTASRCAWRLAEQ